MLLQKVQRGPDFMKHCVILTVIMTLKTVQSCLSV